MQVNGVRQNFNFMDSRFGNNQFLHVHANSVFLAVSEEPFKFRIQMQHARPVGDQAGFWRTVQQFLKETWTAENCPPPTPMEEPR